MKKIAAAVLGGLFVATSVAGTAVAATTYPKAGGVWEHGANKHYVYSYYVNYTPKHSTSVKGKYGVKRSTCAGKNKWAKIRSARMQYGNKTHFYNKC